jgi:endonuclease G, mitochondrial
MNIPEYIDQAALYRARDTKEQRARAFQLSLQAPVLRAAAYGERLIETIIDHVDVDRETAEAIAEGGDPAAMQLSANQVLLARTILSPTVDFLPIEFVEEARTVANAVGRFVTTDEVGAGTFFMISPDLLITNHHVITDTDIAGMLRAEFNFEAGSGKEPTRFHLDSKAFFVTNGADDLDFTLIALGSHDEGPGKAEDFGFCKLFEHDNMHAVDTFVNIIQHPHEYDEFKNIVVRENRVVHETDGLLHYIADTTEGSSGAAVFNDDWEIVALHHWAKDLGTLPLPCGMEVRDKVNEGIRASAIIEALRNMQIEPHMQPLLDVILAG